MKSTIEFIPSCMHTEHFHHHHPLRSFEKVLKTLISQMYEKKWIICSTFFGEELLTVTTGSKIHPFSIRIRHQRLYQVSKWIFVALLLSRKNCDCCEFCFWLIFFSSFPAAKSTSRCFNFFYISIRHSLTEHYSSVIFRSRWTFVSFIRKTFFKLI